MTDFQKINLVAPSAALDHGQSEEDLARADTYGLIAELFAAPPSDVFFSRMAASPKPDPADDAPLTVAWRGLLTVAIEQAPVASRAEYDALFYSVGKPEIMLNGSFYLAGAQNRAPLVELRSDLALLGIERDPSSSETEDHLSGLCEVMRYLVAGDSEPDASGRSLLEQQQVFFQKHLGGWVFDCLDQLERHPKSVFYAAVAQFARCFFEIERQAFDIFGATQAAAQGLPEV